MYLELIYVAVSLVFLYFLKSWVAVLPLAAYLAHKAVLGVTASLGAYRALSSDAATQVAKESVARLVEANRSLQEGIKYVQEQNQALIKQLEEREGGGLF